MPTANEIIINVQELEPRLRHQTIFEVFDGLKEGESFIIHNNHDPRPVYYQLMDIRGNVFDWEYLEQGPEWWDIRVTRNTPLLPDEGRDFIVNVPNIEPKHKHETIFKVFNSFSAGESFVIHNDHDPKPLYYQLLDQHGESFTWEYIQAGPQWWDIRVTIKNMPIAGAKEGETVLNIPTIEPRLKHHTIFQTFEDLNFGDSFIIHNDHDPKPVYFQLANLHGEDAFTWEYLQQGPQWFDIRVTKVDKSETVNTSVTKNEDGDTVINIPAIEPRLKHSTIFQVFDSLKPGESLIIHNDHDPKPVYYQLQNDKGDVFTWNYLQQGPQWWDIKVTKKGNEIMETIGQIVAKDLGKSDVFKKYGIDFCCGGEKTVRQVCAEMGIDPEPVENELRKPSSGGSSKGAHLDFDDWGLDFLADYIKNTHHKYAKKNLPEIGGYAKKVAQVHGDRHPELHKINDLVITVINEMNDHMEDEEKRLFPIIKEIVNTKEEGGNYTRQDGDTFRSIVKEHFKEHEEVGEAVKSIRKLSRNFAIPEDACTSYKLLFKMLEDFETDLFTHIHLENNILFPKAEELELSLQ